MRGFSRRSAVAVDRVPLTVLTHPRVLIPGREPVTTVRRPPIAVIRKKGEPIEAEPMDAAAEYVAVCRKRKNLKTDISDLEARKAELEDHLGDLMLHGRLSSSFKVDGASVFRKYEVWVGAPDIEVGGKTVKDHDTLAAALKAAGLTEYLPKTVNTRSLTSYFTDHLGEDTPENRMKPIEQRLLEGGIPPELLAVVKITEKHPVNANGL